MMASLLGRQQVPPNRQRLDSSWAIAPNRGEQWAHFHPQLMAAVTIPAQSATEPSIAGGGAQVLGQP